jgi:hypothetical protein
MTTRLNANSDFVVLLRNYVLIALSWVILCFLSAYWNIAAEKEKTLELAQKEAMTVFDKDQAFRFWATDHEGVYVPVTERTPPNEYLSHILERDLVNPQWQATYFDESSLYVAPGDESLCNFIFNQWSLNQFANT